MTEQIFAPDVMSARCPSRAILSHITSKWGVLILVALRAGPLRYSALRGRISDISERMLSQTLKTLEADGLITRHALPVVPPHVTYTLTPLGLEAAGHVAEITHWIETNLDRFHPVST